MTHHEATSINSQEMSTRQRETRLAAQHGYLRLTSIELAEAMRLGK